MLSNRILYQKLIYIFKKPEKTIIMKKLLQITFILAFTFSFGQASLPIYEGFDYTPDAKLFTYSGDLASSTALGSWVVLRPTTNGVPGNFTSGQDDILISNDLLASWSYAGIAPSGAAISFKGAGGDPHLPFTNPNTNVDKTITKGSVYATFIFKITDNSGTTEGSINQLFCLGLPNSTGFSTNYSSGIMIRTAAGGKGTAAGLGSFNIGLDKNSTSATTVWDTTNYAVGTEMVIVLSYNFTTNTASMWVNPTLDPAVQPVATFSTTTGTDVKYLDRIRIQQSNAAATPTVFMDEIRVATSWSEVLGGPAPIITPTPTVEKKLAFNSSSNPTVANLLANATAAVGGTINWYDVATGGTVLGSTTAISSKNYYASQTISGIESERISTSVYVGDTSLKTLPLYENFDYNLGDKLVTILNDGKSGTGIGSWSVATGSSALSVDDMLIAAQPSPWTSSVLPAPTGYALAFDKSGLDPQLLFAAPTTGSLYASCLFMVTNLNAITAGTSGTSTDVPPAPAHIFSFAYADAPAGSNTSYTAAVYLKSSLTAGKFNIGINASPIDPIAVGDIKWDTADYDVNTPITAVIRYSYDDLISKLFINPTSNSVEPAPNATTLARIGALNFDRIRLNQNSSATTPFITLDEIRVANNFSYVTGGPDLKVAKMDVSKFAVYPNPVTDGKLYISSDNNGEKQVAIFSVLGQKVFETKTANNTEINVSQLAKGAYILNITEDGKSENKKLMIK